PPAAGTNHVQSAVAVHVGHAEPVREFLRARHFLARLARDTDRVHLPELCWIFTRAEPSHLSLVFLAFRLPAHDQHALAGAEQIDVLRRLVAGAVPNRVLLPMAGQPALAGVLVPVARSAGEADDDVVRPAVAVDVIGPASEAFTVSLEGLVVAERLANLVHRLPIWAFVPNFA